LRLDSESYKPRAFGFNFIARAISTLVVTTAAATSNAALTEVI
jgi:hypothetical protein